MAIRVSQLVKNVGLKPGDVVGIYLPNSEWFAASFFGLARSGMVTLTLSTKYTAEELQAYLTHRPIAYLITDTLHLEKIQKITADLDSDFCMLNIEEARVLDPGLDSGPEPVEADTPLLMQFSTGSTGKPKAVIRTHGNLLAEIAGATRRTQVTAADRIAAFVPLFHAHGFANAMCAALFNGATLVTAFDFNPRSALKRLADERITIFPAVPFMIQMIVMTKLKTEIDLGNLRLCFTAGAPLEQSIAQGFTDRFDCAICQLYGSTETGALALDYSPTDNPNWSSVGVPFDHVDVGVFNESGQCLPQGEIGEIGILTSAATKGYDNNPDATQNSFRLNRFFPGDLGLIDATGRLKITGRKSLFINVGGNKVDPAEVEAIISQLTGVKEVACVGLPAEYGGELIKAVLVLDSPLARDAVLQHCVQQLAPFKVPKIIEFRDELPRSPLGKILRKFLIDPVTREELV